MSDGPNAEDVFWVEPKERGVVKPEEFNIPRSLRRALNKKDYKVTINQDFETVIRSCAELDQGRDETWINETIISWYMDLHHAGYAHSVETRTRAGELTGGLYGVSVGAVFCGESMFSRATNASKIALVHLMARLWGQGYKLCDAQFTNPHLDQFGFHGIPQKEYLKSLSEYRDYSCEFSGSSITSSASSSEDSSASPSSTSMAVSASSSVITSGELGGFTGFLQSINQTS